MALVAWVTVCLVLGAEPKGSRVKDDQGCEKGLDADNELDGEIVCTWPNGTRRYEGMYKHGKRVGLARTWRDDGKLGRTEHFVDGVRTGLVEEYARQGWLEESCEYKNEKKHGRCKIYGFEGKLTEERQYVEGDQRGAFTGFHRNGKVLEKGFLDDTGRPHGLRERFRENGAPESSESFTHGEKDGVEKHWHPNGKLASEAAWKAGKEHGLRTRWHDTGQVAEVSCRQNGESVLGTLPCTGKTGSEVVVRSFPNGKPSETTTVRDGKRNGEQQRFSKDGVRRESARYADDQLDGLQQLFAESGKLERQVTWKAGRRDGPETAFFEDGKVSEEIGWKDGAKVSLTTWWMNGKKKLAQSTDRELWKRQTWHDNGQLESEDSYRGEGYREQREGLERRWSERGALLEERRWKAGKRDGVQKWFEENKGKARGEEQWAAGVRTARKEWDEAGTLVKDEAYNADGSRK